MRYFADRSGLEWQIVIGRESWGSYLAILVPIGRSEPVRCAPLRGVAHDDAITEVEALDEDGLQRLLDNSRVRES